MSKWRFGAPDRLRCSVLGMHLLSGSATNDDSAVGAWLSHVGALLSHAIDASHSLMHEVYT